MGSSASLVDPPSWRDVWKSVSMKPGEPSVITPGRPMMEMSSVMNWDSPDLVSDFLFPLVNESTHSQVWRMLV